MADTVHTMPGSANVVSHTSNSNWTRLINNTLPNKNLKTNIMPILIYSHWNTQWQTGDTGYLDVDPALITHAGAQTCIFTVSSEALYPHGSGRRERRLCSVVLMLGHRHQWQPTLVLHRFSVCWWRMLTPCGGVCCEFSAWAQQTNLYAKSAALLEHEPVRLSGVNFI